MQFQSEMKYHMVQMIDLHLLLEFINPDLTFMQAYIICQ